MRAQMAAAAVSPMKREREEDKQSPATEEEEQEQKAKRPKLELKPILESDALVRWTHDHVRLALHPERKTAVTEALGLVLVPVIVDVIVGYCPTRCKRQSSCCNGVCLCTPKYTRVCENCECCLSHCCCHWCRGCHAPFDAGAFSCPHIDWRRRCDLCDSCCEHTCRWRGCGQMNGCEACGNPDDCHEHCDRCQRQK